MRIIFFGTSTFAAKILEFIIQKKILPIAIVTKPDKAKKRSLIPSYPPVKDSAKNFLPNPLIFQPEKASDKTFIEKIRELDPDLFVVVAYGQILKKELLDIPKMAPINIHASLLPKYRGAAPIQRCLMDGANETGITIIKMNVDMDAGEIIMQEKFSLDQTTTFGELEKKLIDLSNILLLQVIKKFETNSVEFFPQDISKVTFAPKISKEELKIDWSKSAHQVHNVIRAFSPKPGAWSLLKIDNEERRVKIYLSEPLEENHKPGNVLQENPLIVGCAKGSIKIYLLQPEGKKVMSSDEWLRGMQKKIFTFH